MPGWRFLLMALALLAGPVASADFVAVPAGVPVALMHVRLIDGSGAAPLEDQRIDLVDGHVARVGRSSAKTPLPAGARILDLRGRTVMPGLVGMHEHLFYPAAEGGPGRLPYYVQMLDSGPRLYLAAGVTTARTAGSMEPYADLALKQIIDRGDQPGPTLFVTGPYIGDLGGRIPQLHRLSDADDAARLVDYWAALGVTSFKAYMDITADALRAAVAHAHARGLKITGHLCSIGFTEAAEIGIDNLEHGIVVDTEFFPGKQPGVCARDAFADLASRVDIDSEPVQAMIRTLVNHHVAVTSTLAVFEITVPGRPAEPGLARIQAALTPQAWSTYRSKRETLQEKNDPLPAAALRKEMQFERAFVRAGGLLMAGCDPTSFGGVLPGYGDQRNLELLVEAGFTPVEAIHIATQNGARYLEDESLGTIGTGKWADLVVLGGNPAAHIEDVEKVELVFKRGVGYDPAALQSSVGHLVGER